MVVDDNEADQFLAKYAIEEYRREAGLSSLEILTAFDGEEALAILEELPPEEQPDIIFLDINMPRMDGFGFLEAYSKLEEPHCRVVVMVTSSDAEEDRSRTREYSMVQKYLGKPLSMEDIKGIVSAGIVP